MRAPLGWLREYAALPAELTGRQLAEGLVRAGLEVETVEAAGSDVTGPLVIGTVLAYEVEEHSNGKAIRWCSVDVGEAEPRGIVCGAHNFEVGDVVVVALPGAVLPGGFAIAARKTYGHVSDGMICSARELGLGDESRRASSCSASPTSAPGRTRRRCCTCATTCWTSRSRRTAATACRSVGWPGSRPRPSMSTFTDPVSRAVPEPVEAGYPVRLEAAACPIFVALTVTGVQADRPSPTWMARRIQLAGMRPISLAVDITNYVMLETGQPIHALRRRPARPGRSWSGTPRSGRS